MAATQLHDWVNGDAAFEFLSLDMPVLRKYPPRKALSAVTVTLY